MGKWDRVRWAIKCSDFVDTLKDEIDGEAWREMDSGTVIAILPCNNLDASERFYGRLGFVRAEGRSSEELASYRILENGKGRLHLTEAADGWLVPGRNPFGLYFYMEDVDGLAAIFRNEIIGKNAPENKAWGMYEFAVSDPDQTLVRIGWPRRLRKSAPV